MKLADSRMVWNRAYNTRYRRYRRLAGSFPVHDELDARTDQPGVLSVCALGISWKVQHIRDVVRHWGGSVSLLPADISRDLNQRLHKSAGSDDKTDGIGEPALKLPSSSSSSSSYLEHSIFLSFPSAGVFSQISWNSRASGSPGKRHVKLGLSGHLVFREYSDKRQ